MSDELVKSVQDFIDSGKGDRGKLEYILEALKEGKSLYSSDQKYLEELLQSKEKESPEEPRNEQNTLRINEIEDRKIENTSQQVKSRNNAKKTIGIGIGISVAIIMIYFGLNLYAINNLQFRGHESGQGNFDFADMSMDFQLEVCNPTFFPATFSKFKGDVIYKSTNFGTLTINGGTVLPQSHSIFDGRMKLNTEALVGLFLKALGSAFSGKDSAFDPNDFNIVLTLDAPIFGIIPFSVTEEYSSNEFQSLMQGLTEKFDC